MSRVNLPENTISRDVHAADIEQLLQAIQGRTSGDMKAWMDNDPSPSRPLYQGQNEKAGSELADSFELDIRDCSSFELNR